MHDIVALYQFHKVDDPTALQSNLLHFLRSHGIRGTLLVANEGINGTVSGSRIHLDSLIEHLGSLGMNNLNVKWSTSHDAPFKRTKVRLKREIVTLGIDDIDPSADAGQYVAPEQWNELLEDPDVVVIDTRNEYETAVGQFDGAIDPSTESFRDFPGYVDRHLDPSRTPKVAMYCTGGIRCEKATALLKQKGFREVYHLHGGILEYLRTVDPADSRWRGDCFVFDERVAVDHQLTPSGHRLCHGCGWAVPPDQIDHPDYRPGVHCPRCVNQLTDEQKKRFAMRQSQIDAQRSRQESDDAS